jgi:hypothetical protein
MLLCIYLALSMSPYTTRSNLNYSERRVYMEVSIAELLLYILFGCDPVDHLHVYCGFEHTLMNNNLESLPERDVARAF